MNFKIKKIIQRERQHSKYISRYEIDMKYDYFRENNKEMLLRRNYHCTYPWWVRKEEG